MQKGFSRRSKNYKALRNYKILLQQREMKKEPLVIAAPDNERLPDGENKSK